MMKFFRSRDDATKERLERYGALSWLLILGVLALAGPYGVLSWGENISVLEGREARIRLLTEQRDELRNLVTRLDPENVDPDLATELVRKNLNVAHPDEYVMEITPVE